MPLPPLQHSAVVTTAHSEGAELLARARRTSELCGLPFVRRGRVKSGSPALVIEAGGAHLALPEAVLRSHPGMGLVRVRRLVRGEEHDPIVDIAELKSGDKVLDATFGFGQDALVAAYAIGATGRLVGTEASPLLAGLALAGGAFWPAPGGEIFARMDVRHADMRQLLRNSAPGAFDVVLIDPMFRHPRPAAPDFAALRMLADDTPLEPEDVELARRAARRWVVVKDAWPGLELKRLGIPTLPFRRSAEIVFGRIAGASADVENSPPSPP